MTRAALQTSQTSLFHQIAEACGVSSATVTLALQDAPRISAETKERVYMAARRAGYRASKVKRESDLSFAVLHGYSSASGNTGMSGSFLHPSNLALWYGITEGVTLVGASVHAYEQGLADGEWNFSTLPGLIRRDKIDGVLLSGTVGPQFYAFLQEAKLPCLRLAADDAPVPMDRLFFDFEAAARLQVEAAIEAGSTRIAYLSRSSRGEIHQLLMRGYRSAMKKHRLAPQVVILESGEHGGGDLDALLKAANCPEVFFLNNRDEGLRLAMAAALKGIRPESNQLKLIVATIDGGLRLRYPLHKIVPDPVALGNAAVERLLQRRQNPDTLPTAFLLGCGAVSTDLLPGSAF